MIILPSLPYIWMVLIWNNAIFEIFDTADGWGRTGCPIHTTLTGILMLEVSEHFRDFTNANGES